jgi:two-component system cell cycle response regulator CtrA
MRVLLIEDDSAVAQSIELMLKSESFNVYTTDLGEEGVDLGKLYDYDIILLDLNLPDMSGYDVLKQLRVSKIKTPILILSGLAGIEDPSTRTNWLPASMRSCAVPRATPSR